jgi:hypothetical protein
VPLGRQVTNDFSLAHVRNAVEKVALEHGFLRVFPFIGPFVKLRKAIIGFVMSVLLSVRLSVLMEQLGSHWIYFDEI